MLNHTIIISISEKDNIWSLGYKKWMASIRNAIKFFADNGIKVFHFLILNKTNKVSYEQYLSRKQLETRNLSLIFINNGILSLIYNIAFRFPVNLVRYIFYFFSLPLFLKIYSYLIIKEIERLSIEPGKKIILYAHGPLSSLITITLKKHFLRNGYCCVYTVWRYYWIINFFDIITKWGWKNLIRRIFYYYYIKWLTSDTDIKIITSDWTKWDKLMQSIWYKNFYYLHDWLDIQLKEINDEKFLHNLSNYKTNFVMVSRLVPNKDIMFAVKAFHKAHVKNSALHIFWDGPLYKVVKDYIEKISINNIFLYGAVDWSLIPSYINKADAFIATSNFSNVSLGFLTALYLWKPVIVTNVWGTNEYVENGRNWYLVNSIDEMAKVFLKIDGKKDLLDEMWKQSKKISNLKGITTTENRLKQEMEILQALIN